MNKMCLFHKWVYKNFYNQVATHTRGDRETGRTTYYLPSTRYCAKCGIRQGCVSVECYDFWGEFRKTAKQYWKTIGRVTKKQ